MHAMRTYESISDAAANNNSGVKISYLEFITKRTSVAFTASQLRALIAIFRFGRENRQLDTSLKYKVL